MSAVANLECHAPLNRRAWECGIGWVEMRERELRRAEVLASSLVGRLTMTATVGHMGID